MGRKTHELTIKKVRKKEVGEILFALDSMQKHPFYYIIKGDIILHQDSENIQASLHIKRDTSFLAVSIRVLGIEVVAIELREDSIIVVNRRNKKWSSASSNEIIGLTEKEHLLLLVDAMLLGRPYLEEKIHVFSTDSLLVITDLKKRKIKKLFRGRDSIEISDEFVGVHYLDRNHPRLVKSVFYPGMGRRFVVKYGYPLNASAEFPFPAKIDIEISTLHHSYSFSMNIDRVGVWSPLGKRVKIPSRYRKVLFNELFLKEEHEESHEE